jgi:hypothetical protein
VAELDEVIDRCTRRNPSERPSVAELSRELRAWLAYTPAPGEPDLGDVLAQFRHAHSDSFDAQARRDQWLQRFSEIRDLITETTVSWVSETLREAGLRPAITFRHDLSEWVERTRHMGVEAQLAEAQLWVTSEFGDPDWPTKIAVGVGIDVDAAGEFWCAAHVAWGDMESTATRQLQIDEKIVPIESIEISSGLDDLNHGVQEACVQMLRELGETPQT